MLSLATHKKSLANNLGKLFNNRLFILSVFILLPVITTYRQYHTGASHNIFSNLSELTTYIIAVSGFAIWFMLQEKPISPIVITLKPSLTQV